LFGLVGITLLGARLSFTPASEDLLDVDDAMEDPEWIHARSQEILRFFLKPDSITEDSQEEVPPVDMMPSLIEDDESDEEFPA
jgi:hypothetical protein